jgi:hypothetical protein
MIVTSLARAAALALLCTVLSQCSSSLKKADVVVSVADQKMGLYSEGELVKTFPVSTSKFGLGDQPGSNRTPIGRHRVVAKVGHGLPEGAVLKSRHWNGEVIKPNAPGRDPIVSRILWLSGSEGHNRNAYSRCIYIHGTPEEKRLGAPASYGCVRMASDDVVKVFNQVPVGASVVITPGKLPSTEAQAKREVALVAPPPAPTPAAAPTKPESVAAKSEPAAQKTESSHASSPKPGVRKSEDPVTKRQKISINVAS